MRRFSTGLRYDPELDKFTWGGWKPYFDKDRPQWKSELYSEQGHKALAKKKRQNDPNLDERGEERKAAEERAVAALRKAVEMLEFSLLEMQAFSVPMVFEHQINHKQLHNAVAFMRTKCGVKFEPSEFDVKVSLDGVRRYTYDKPEE